MAFAVVVTFVVHSKNQYTAEARLAQRLEVARLVRPAGTPPDDGMIEGYEVLDRPDLMEHALDTPRDVPVAIDNDAEIVDDINARARLQGWPGTDVPAEFLGVRTMRRSLALATKRREMLDGSPCWCVSDDLPHEGWVHGAACLEMRSALA